MAVIEALENFIGPDPTLSPDQVKELDEYLSKRDTRPRQAMKTTANISTQLSNIEWRVIGDPALPPWLFAFENEAGRRRWFRSADPYQEVVPIHIPGDEVTLWLEL
jgi:hypothetical protein